MENKFVSCVLEDICSKQNKSIISGPFGSNISSKYFVEHGVPVIRGNNLTVGKEKFLDFGFAFVTEEKAEELNCYAVEDDLIFTSAGTLGQVGIIPKDAKYKEYVISNKQIRVTVDKNIILPMYAYYWFSSPWIQKKLTDNNKGSTVPLLTLSEIKSLPIKFPKNIKTQEKIVNILYSIDEQIKRNKELVQKLQVLTHSIYSSWFVQFDFPNNEGKPYKTSGGKMIYNKELKREIPYGWEVKKLKDLLFKVNREFDYSKEEKTIDLSVMPSNSFYLSEINSSINFTTNLYSMKNGDILFGSIRPYLKKAGIAPCDGAVAGTVHCLNAFNSSDYNFCLLTLCSNNLFNYANKVSKGTKMPVISCDDLLEYPVAYDSKVVKMFNNINLKEIVPFLFIENQRFSNLKNYLLPLLINGQLQ